MFAAFMGGERQFGPSKYVPVWLYPPTSCPVLCAHPPLKLNWRYDDRLLLLKALLLMVTETLSVASTRVQSWGDEAPKPEGGEVWGGGVISLPGTPPLHRGGVWEGQFFCFVDSKWRILVNSEMLNLKCFLCGELPQCGLGRFCGKFWIFEQSNE